MRIEYIDNDLDSPKYLFAGSPLLLEYLEPRKAHDKNHNPLNEDTAVYLTSSWIIASAYSFGKNDKYSGSFGTDRIDGNPYVFFENDNDKFIHNGGRSLQYRCHEKIMPIEIITVKFKDFKDLYNIENRKKMK